MNIRQATESDLINIQKCNEACLSENYDMFIYQQLLSTWSQLIYVADYKSQIIGYVIGGVIDNSEDKKDDEGEIISLAVLKPYRRRNIANTLLQFVHHQLKSHFKLEHVRLNARPSNMPGLKLYDKLGYVHDHTKKEYYDDNEDALGMIKKL